MMHCVLSPTQVAEQSVIVQKVDQHVRPPPEDVYAVEDALHHQHPHIQNKCLIVSLVVVMMCVLAKLRELPSIYTHTLIILCVKLFPQ
jgi:hypothetical protein